MILVAAVTLILLTGPDGQVIRVNPLEIVSVRGVRASEHFYEGARCIIHMADGKPIIVKDTCDEVTHAIEDAEQ